MRARDERYLLPFSGLLVVLAGVELVDLVDRRIVPKKAAIALTCAVLLAGSLSMREFRDFNCLLEEPAEPLDRGEAPGTGGQLSEGHGT